VFTLTVLGPKEAEMRINFEVAGGKSVPLDLATFETSASMLNGICGADWE
jgi:hypothetical protein